MRDLTATLQKWLEKGGREVGEVSITANPDGYALCHRADGRRGDLIASCEPEAARGIANFDDTGKFRPLKTAPNLRRGWKLQVGSLGELRRALDYFYPAMIGVWASHTRGELEPVPLRATLGRQSGMYRVTQKLSDDQAQALIGSFCPSQTGCLKNLLWRISPELPIQTLPAEKLQVPESNAALPLLCHEACNLLVAQARMAVKQANA